MELTLFHYPYLEQMLCFSGFISILVANPSIAVLLVPNFQEITQATHRPSHASLYIIEALVQTISREFPLKAVIRSLHPFQNLGGSWLRLNTNIGQPNNNKPVHDRPVPTAIWLQKDVSSECWACI